MLDSTYRHTSGLLFGARCYMKAGMTKEANDLMIYGASIGAVDKRSKRDITNPLYRDSLIVMYIEDQGVRLNKSITKELESNGFGHLFKYARNTTPFRELNRDHIIKLERMIRKYGFPTRESVGRYGMKGARMILLHSDSIFLTKYIDEIKKHFNSQTVAIAIDKLCVAKNIEQQYGTQAVYNDRLNRNELYKIKSIETVDDNRYDLGLIPLKVYCEIANIYYPAPD